MKKRKYLVIVLMILMLNNTFAFAKSTDNKELEIENYTFFVEKEIENVEDILDDFMNDGDELKKKADAVIEKNAENFFVKLFKKIIKFISDLLDRILKIALEITKLGR